MRIGYPCINRSIACQGDKTFRLKSYSVGRLVETVENNLGCLAQILKFNLRQNILFFRITSDLVPFASHPVCKFDWQTYFKKRFREIGEFIRSHQMRISMHPDQFTLINSQDRGVFRRSVKELFYHCQVLDLMRLDRSAKIQMHVGGVYGDKRKSMGRFTRRFSLLDRKIRRRLVIENDDRNYNLRDCVNIHEKTGVPVIFDSFHHELNSSGESIARAIQDVTETWSKSDGVPVVDYSSQQPGKRKGKHAESIDLKQFERFLRETNLHDLDIMLEIKDKEASAIKAVKAAWPDSRLIKPRERR